MLYLKDGLPEEGELVICTVTMVQGHSVFVKLDEYGKSGMIHISEIFPGRIRNIRDFVVEDKVIVCKVLRINEERGHIDLSLRRVGEGQRREKVNEVKQEQKAEKIIEFVAKQQKMTTEELFGKIQKKIFAKYPTIYSCFEEVVNQNDLLTKLGIEEKYTKYLTEIILQRIKPPEVRINGNIKLFSYASNGVEIIKKVLHSIVDADKENISILYYGGGSYGFSMIGEDYKSAEKKLKDIMNETTTFAQKNKCTFEFEKIENK
jgi:translation initiation factor 2 subunit 1